MRQLPNILTIGRIAVIPIMVILFYMPGETARWINCGLFVLAAITDFFDGWLARRWDTVSSLGRFLDPIADKLLVAAILLMLAATDALSTWSYPAACIILMREILVSGLREYLAELQVSMPVSTLAKWKTTVQLIALPVLIVGDVSLIPLPVQAIGEVLLWAAAVMTLITGYDYLRVGLRHMDMGTTKQ